MAMREQDLAQAFNAPSTLPPLPGQRQPANSIPSPNTSPSRPPSTRRVNTTLSGHASVDEQHLVNQVTQLFFTARQRRRPLIARWNRSYRMLRNRYWSDSRPSWMPSPSIPEIFPIVASMVGWMTDQRFDHEVTPASLPFSPFHNLQAQAAADLETVLDSTWHVNQEENEVTISLWDAFTYGTGVLKTIWDSSLQGGLGDAIIKRVDPYTFYPDPAATSLRDANYFIEARTMSIQEIDRRWPGAARHMPSGGNREDIDKAPDPITSVDDGSMPRANPGAISPAVTPRYGRPGGAQIHILEDEGVTVLECWVREHEIFDVTRIGPQGRELTDTRVYDTWRVIVIANNRVLMNETADDLWSHGSHPYSRYVPTDLGEFWGISLVELLASPQETINRLLAAIQQNIELVGNPVFMEQIRSGLSRQQITNKPGQRLTTNMAKGGEWLTPPALTALQPEMLRYYLQRMEAVSGLSAITKGGAPGGRNAQGVIDSMQEAAFVRIRMALRNLEYALRDAGEKKASLITEFYTSPRIVSIVGNTGERSAIALKSRHFYTPSDTGEVPMRFNLLVNAGSSSHTSRKVREDQIVMLFSLGVVDEQAVLEILDIPNRQVILERVRKLKSAGAFQPPGARQRAQH